MRSGGPTRELARTIKRRKIFANDLKKRRNFSPVRVDNFLLLTEYPSSKLSARMQVRSRGSTDASCCCVTQLIPRSKSSTTLKEQMSKNVCGEG